MPDIPKADPASKPRIGQSGVTKRDPPIFGEVGDTWEVKVTPLPDASSEGRPLEGGGHKARAMFEVRAEFIGHGLPGLPPLPGGIRRIETWLTPNMDLARVTAREASRLLAGGAYNLYLPSIAASVQMP